MLLLAALPVGAAASQMVPGHVPEMTRGLQPLGPLPATNRLNLALGLPLRNPEALTNLLQRLYDPASPEYRRFLTPAEFTERFGPARSDYESVVAFARTNGLTISGVHPNRMLVDVIASAADIQRVFHLTLNVFRHPTENRAFFAPTNEPSLDLTVKLAHISGLDNSVLPRPCLAAVPLSQHPGAVSGARSSSSARTWPQGRSYEDLGAPKSAAAVPQWGSGPRGLYWGNDFRAAYAPGLSFTGSGQRVGLFELDGYYPGDVAAYLSDAGLPSVALTNVLLDGFDGTPGGGNIEVALDIDMSIAMAPGLAQVIVYEGTVAEDVLNRMATDNLARQLSCSWTWSPFSVTSAQIIEEIAAQGQSMFVASGDSDAYPGSPMPPTDDPYITSAGGTTLTTSNSAWVAERVWNWGGGLGSSGGVSTRYAIPTWQQGINMSANQGSTTMRNIPDVALIADNVYVIADNGTAYEVGGTSCAAPLWAGLTALANQLGSAYNQPAVGFLNPALHALAQSSSYASCFHDITSGNNESPASTNKYSATPGYDLCTGWGTPVVSNLIYAIGFTEPLQISPLAGLSFSGPAGGPVGPAPQICLVTNQAGGTLNWMVANSAPWLSISPTNGALSAGGPAAVLTASLTALASNLPPGSYTAALAFTNLDTHQGQIRPLTLSIVTAPAITSQPGNQAVFQGMNASFSVGTTPDAQLAYQWQFDNGSFVTELTDGGAISGSSTSTLTISDVQPANVGAYSVVLSNVAGVLTSSNAFLTILPWRPVITVQPTNKQVLPGSTVTLAVRVVGTPPFSYQWQLNGTNLTDGNGFTSTAGQRLHIRPASPALQGTYSVVISNAFGSVTSDGATFTLIPVTSPGATFTVLHSFSGGDGASPYAPLTGGADGNWYGATVAGGSNGSGTLFQLTPGGDLAVEYSFANLDDGGLPYAGLASATNGLLYGLASQGGLFDNGTVFSLTTNGAFTVLNAFDSTDGSNAVAGLTAGTDGSFYGVALEGGTNGLGVVFRLMSDNTIESLLDFDQAAGAYPSGALVRGLDGAFYGTTIQGGLSGWGNVFRVTASGALTTLHTFTNLDGAYPYAGLAQDLDGSLYGVTYQGGAYGFGAAFKCQPQGGFTNLYSFTGQDDGLNPFGGLLVGADGNLYGTTEGGGAYGRGTVFSLSPSGVLTTLVQFDSFQGANPEAALVQDSQGNLFGTTANGGLYSDGVIFRVSIDSPLQITSQPQTQLAFLGQNVTFSVATLGNFPLAYQWRKNGKPLSDTGNVSSSASRALVLTNIAVTDAASYSVVITNASGSVTSGNALLQLIVSPPDILSGPEDQTTLVGDSVMFEVEASGDLPLSYQWQKNGTNLADTADVSGSATSQLTLESVTLADQGTYSVIVSNALDVAASAGAMLTVLPVTAPGTRLSSIYAFSGGDGLSPYAGLVQGPDGNLYGTTYAGGGAGFGTVYRISTNGAFASLYSFANGSDGSYPYAGLAVGPDNNLYGAAFQGGLAGYGTLFQLTPAGALTPLHWFTGGDDGSYPAATFVLGPDGFLYGAGYAGGFLDSGTLFKFTTDGSVFPLAMFDSTNGSDPQAPLLLGADNLFYGTAFGGGAGGYGSVFTLDLKRSLFRLASFNNTNGASPACGLVQTADGTLYGTTYQGGAYGYGTIFELTTNGVITTLVSCDFTNGAYPGAGLLLGSDANLYGTTSAGGVGGGGTLFEITPAHTLTTLVWFDGANGANPEAPLIQANDGCLYGTTASGGLGYDGSDSSGNGTIFRLMLTVPPAITTTISRQDTNLVLRWFGGSPPYQVQMATRLANPDWTNLGASLALDHLILTPTNTAAFYRVQGQ